MIQKSEIFSRLGYSIILNAIGDFGIAISLLAILYYHTIFAWINFIPLNYSGYALNVIIFASYFRFYAIKEFKLFAIFSTLMLYGSSELFSYLLASIQTHQIIFWLNPSAIFAVSLIILLGFHKVHLRRPNLWVFFPSLVLLGYSLFGHYFEFTEMLFFGSWLVVWQTVLKFK